MSNFYLVEGLVADDFAVSKTIVLSPEESRHAVSVGRLRIGERILIGNGLGVIAETIALNLDSKALMLEVLSYKLLPKSTQGIVLVQALAKKDRAELAVQACVELGVDAVIPWQSERCVSKWDNTKAIKGVTRWRKIVREASKQSIRAYLPDVYDLHSTKDLLALSKAERSNSLFLFLDPYAETRISSINKDFLSSFDTVYVLVGPEGGFSDKELSVFSDSGFCGFALGSNILRTSTAGAAALSVLNVISNRW